jgi:hypothetical protein
MQKITKTLLIFITMISLSACSSTIPTEEDIIIGPSGIHPDQTKSKWSIYFGLTISKHSGLENINNITGIEVDTNQMESPFQEIKISQMTDTFEFNSLKKLDEINLPINLSKDDHILIVLISNVEPSKLDIYSIQIEYADGKILTLDDVGLIMERLKN